MANKISQREARRLRRELKELQKKHSAMQRSYVSSYPGICIRTRIPLDPITKEALNTAARLGHGLAARVENDALNLYAVKG